jgi:hypothetical protein
MDIAVNPVYYRGNPSSCSASTTSNVGNPVWNGVPSHVS